MNYLSRLISLLIATSGVYAFAQSTNAAFLYSTNLQLSQRFWRSLDQSNSPVTVLAFGDSMADPNVSIQLELFNRLQGSFGARGYSIDSWWQKSTGVSFFYDGDTNWWAPHALMPPGEFIYWDKWGHPVTCLGLFWVAGPDGGLFNVSVSTNNAPWSGTLLTLNGHSPTPVGCFTNLCLPRNRYRLRVDGVSGTNVFIGPLFMDTSQPGVHVAYMSRGSASLSNVFQVSTNILYPILTALNPQLVICHLKELDTPASQIVFSNSLFDLEAMWKSCVKDGEIVYLGTPYDYRDDVWERTGLENLTLRQAAIRDHRIYLDCMTPCISYQYMTNVGYLEPGQNVHPTKACNQFLADVLWKQLGWFGVGLDSKLAIRANGAGTVLQWSSATNLSYRLDQSADLLSWTAVGTQSGTGLVCAWTNSTATAPSYFRLAITQP